MSLHDSMTLSRWDQAMDVLMLKILKGSVMETPGGKVSMRPLRGVEDRDRRLCTAEAKS